MSQHLCSYGGVSTRRQTLSRTESSFMRATGPNQPGQILLDVRDCLNELGIAYAVIGALAVSYYGIPRSTSDADAVIWLKDTQITSGDLTKRLGLAGFNAELKRGDLEDPVVGAIAVEDRHQNRVDLLLGLRGMDPEAIGRCLESPLLDSTVRIIAAEDLIAMKIFVGGFRDLEDVRGILQVSGDQLNLDLLRKLARRYGPAVAKKLEDFLQEPPLPTE